MASVVDRGADRHRRILLTSIANVFARGVTVLTSFATIPMTAKYLGHERFGLWMTISSFMALFAFADLGMGNGLLNAVAQAHGRDDVAAIRKSVSSAFAVLTSLGLLIALAMTPPSLLVDWVSTFNLRDPLAAQEVRPALVAFMLCFSAGVPLAICGRCQLGLQMGFVSGLWQALGSLLGLAGVLLVIHLQGGLPWLVLALLGGPLVAAAANTVVFFGAQAPNLRPRPRDVSRETMLMLVKLGGLFFVLQLAMALAYASDNALAAHLLGAKAVGDYAIATKLFAISSIVVGMLLQPLWPAYGEAMARKDIAWARATLKRTSVTSVSIAAVIALSLLLGFDLVARLWVGRKVAVPTSLLAGLAAWAIVDAWGVSLAMFLNGAHIVRLQVLLATAFSLTCFALKIVFVSRFGVAAFPWTTLLVYIPISLVPVLVLMHRWLPPGETLTRPSLTGTPQ